MAGQLPQTAGRTTLLIVNLVTTAKNAPLRKVFDEMPFTVIKIEGEQRLLTMDLSGEVLRDHVVTVDDSAFDTRGEPMRIIINCDDLGANATVNDSILELMEQRRVTSATLMMNAPAIELAVRRIGNFPYCSFGVHLNVTEFAPLSTIRESSTLLNEKDKFAGNARRDPINIPLTAAACEGVYSEWCAQIERALALSKVLSATWTHIITSTRSAGLLACSNACRRNSEFARFDSGAILPGLTPRYGIGSTSPGILHGILRCGIFRDPNRGRLCGLLAFSRSSSSWARLCRHPRVECVIPQRTDFPRKRLC